MPMPNTGAPPAAPGEEDPFAMFRKQIAGLDGPGKKKALQDFEDSMFQIMQDNLSDVYAEADAQDQPAPAPKQPPAASMDGGPGHGRVPMDEPASRSIIDDPDAIDPPEGFDDVASPTKYRQPPENSEMSDEEKQSRGRVMFDKEGGVAEAADGYVDENDPDLPYGASALPKGVMKGKPPPTEEEYGGKTDSWVTAMYRWEKDNGIEYGSPEYEQALKKAQRGNGRSTPLENDMEGMPKPRMSMMGRY